MNIYQDIAQRTGGEIYIGVVGPVRTGKSTFIQRFTEEFIFPNMAEDYGKERLRDELPQSGAGRIIMTSQPKFVPDKAVDVMLDDNIKVKVRLVDCVGFLIDGVSGHTDNGKPRMVRTPWSENEMPFETAADIGTQKVIKNHSTLGILVTSDGSITDIPRENYVEAEEKTVNELKAVKKPFGVILNTKHPDSEEAKSLARSLGEKYGVPVNAVDVMNIDAAGISSIFGGILQEFPLIDVKFDIPEWVFSLELTHDLLGKVISTVRAIAESVDKIKDIRGDVAAHCLNESDGELENVYLDEVDLGSGTARYTVDIAKDVYYKVLSERCGCKVENDLQLLEMMKDFVRIKEDYMKVEPALRSVRQTGYGMVQPSLDEITLEEPELVHNGSKYGVKLKASAPSLHFLRADVDTVVSPVVGTEKQSEEFVSFLLEEFEKDTQKIWETDIFGKSLQDLVKEGLSSKLMDMPEDVRGKLQETLRRIINDGTEGVMCIIL